MARPLLEMVQDTILEHSTALGNTKTNFAKVAADLLNQEGRKRAGIMAEGCFLSKATITRLMDDGGDDTYHPQAETVERVFRYFGAEVHFRKISIKPKWQNKAKE